MIHEIPSHPCPEWLLQISATSPFPGVKRIVADSLYYPACGLNGTPVKYLAGNVHSFVYADYGITEREFLDNLNGGGPDDGFKHYHPVVQRKLSVHDVVPANWRPELLPTDRDRQSWLIEQERRCQPFGHWSVWQRYPDAPEDHGPQRFSFLYLAGEMSACYQGLYCWNRIAPTVLAIIQPGAIGGEWENTCSDSSFFKRVVRSNRAGLPPYLLHGGYGFSYPEACWAEYKGPALARIPERSAGLWRLGTSACGQQASGSSSSSGSDAGRFAS